MLWASQPWLPLQVKFRRPLCDLMVHFADMTTTKWVCFPHCVWETSLNSLLISWSSTFSWPKKDIYQRIRDIYSTDSNNRGLQSYFKRVSWIYKCILWWARKSEKAGLKLNFKKTKITASSPITSWQIEVGKVKAVRFSFQNHCGWWLQTWN